MSKSELIVGLDIGTTKICAVVGEPSENGGMDIVGIGTSPSTGLRKGVVVNIEQTVQSIKRALGGQNLTNDIAFGLRTPMAAAEKIKIKHGAAIAEMVRPDEYIEVPSVGGREPRRLSRQVLAEICEPRMEEILTLLDQELVRSGLKNMIGAGVVLTGGTALIQGCQELGEQVFNLPTRIGYPRNVGGLKDMVNSPKFATAMGLLRFGAEKEGMEQKFRIRSDGNVFNSILSRMKKWFSEIS